MISRVLAIALNTYREAVRARILYGLLGAALATSIYAVLVATLSLHQEVRVIADVGAASISLYAVIVAIVIGASSLHRELELKTIFPILTRRLHRSEYVVGKYLGLLATLAVFVAIDGATVLAMLALQTKQPVAVTAGTAGGMLVVLAVLLWRARYTRVFMLLPWSVAFFVAMLVVSRPAESDARLVLASCLLTLCEVGIVGAVAMVFSAFSSPFLTATFTLGLWLMGRSSETLANLPVRVFGSTIKNAGLAVARVVPNLQLFVPPRPVLLGHVPDLPVWPFVGRAALVSAAYATVLLTVSAIVFRRRDFS